MTSKNVQRALLVLLIAGVGVGPRAAVGQDTTAGRAAYQQSCAECHGSRLQGGAHGPALTGVGFSSVWGERRAEALLDFVRREMPPGQRPLQDAVYLNIVAFVLETDGRASGEVIAAAADVETPAPGWSTTRYGDREATGLSPVTDAMLRQPPAADWLTWRRTLDNHGYSPLDQISRDNVGELRLAWVLSMRNGVNQTAPVVHDGVMFLANPGNVVQAIEHG